jgi:hypothetical protein
LLALLAKQKTKTKNPKAKPKQKIFWFWFFNYWEAEKRLPQKCNSKLKNKSY